MYYVVVQLSIWIEMDDDDTIYIYGDYMGDWLAGHIINDKNIIIPRANPAPFNFNFLLLFTYMYVVVGTNKNKVRVVVSRPSYYDTTVCKVK